MLLWINCIYVYVILRTCRTGRSECSGLSIKNLIVLYRNVIRLCWGNIIYNRKVLGQIDAKIDNKNRRFVEKRIFFYLKHIKFMKYIRIIKSKQNIQEILLFPAKMRIVSSNSRLAKFFLCKTLNLENNLY